MGGIRTMAAVGVVVGAGFLAGCCLFSGPPTVTIMGPTTAPVGTAVTFTATATGGGGTYTYMWSFGGSGSMATHTFPSVGTHMVGVTVTDNCGRSATAMVSVTVTEGAGGGGNLTGMWTGMIFDNQGVNTSFDLQITHVGTNVTALVRVLLMTSTGTGSYAAGRFMLNFQWPATDTMVLLQGTHNPHANELSGDWMVGGLRMGTWRVRR